MSEMHAIVIEGFGGPEVLAEASIEKPLRAGAEFLIKIVAAGVNPIDAKTRAGNGVSSSIGSLPAVLGNDFSGVVVESPYAAHPLQPGDEVYGMIMVPRLSGSYAEYAVVPSLSVARKPKGLSHVEAAGIPVAALTAWGMVVEVARAHEGQRVLIHAGAGGVGHFAVQFASYFGAQVIATASAQNLDWLRELGASEVIDHENHRFEDEVDDVDVVIDLVGNEKDATGTRSLAVLRPAGLLINLPTNSWPSRQEECARAGIRSTDYSVAPDGATLAVISRLLESGDVRVFVDQVFPLDRVADAHRLLENGHARGKIVVTVSDV